VQRMRGTVEMLKLRGDQTPKTVEFKSYGFDLRHRDRLSLGTALMQTLSRGYYWGHCKGVKDDAVFVVLRAP
jgi:hypothetical protein